MLFVQQLRCLASTQETPGQHRHSTPLTFFNSMSSSEAIDLLAAAARELHAPWEGEIAFNAVIVQWFVLVQVGGG